MKPETDPITEDEWLLRRVRFERFRTDKIPILSPNAFEPRIKGLDPDIDGINLYREACLADPLDVLATVSKEKWNDYGIVRISVSSLHLIELSVASKPNDQIKGHVVIPELNSADYEANPSQFTSIKLFLAEQASNNIVLWPVEKKSDNN